MASGKTFDDLGIPFPLFEAPVEDASEYVGPSTCSTCGKQGDHCFELEIGCALTVECSHCGTENGLDAYDREAGPCHQCGKEIAFPEVAEGAITICYACLREGKGAITKDTELGMVSWEQAYDGVTHGLPGLDRSDFEMVPKVDNWVGVRLDRQIMYELLRMPTYLTIQGECWLFCCRRPMVFLGCWSRDDFTRNAPDGDGKAYFSEIIQDDMPGLWEDQLHDVTGIYVFKCQNCDRLKANWDIA